MAYRGLAGRRDLMNRFKLVSELLARVKHFVDNSRYGGGTLTHRRVDTNAPNEDDLRILRGIAKVVRIDLDIVSLYDELFDGTIEVPASNNDDE